jgi:hypothetical protein
MQFSTCYSGWWSQGCCHTLISAQWDLRVDVVGIGVGGGSLLVLMIEAPIPFILIAGLLNTYIMQLSTCYSYRGYKMYYLICKWRHTHLNLNNNYLVIGY